MIVTNAKARKGAAGKNITLKSSDQKPAS